MQKAISRVSLFIGAGAVLFAPFFAFAALDDKVTVCHMTSSDTNPVVVISISVNALQAHLDHGDTLLGPNGCGGGGGQV